MMKLRADLVLRHIGKDHVIVDPGQEVVDMSAVFTLNDTAAWLWEQLEGKAFTRDTVVELLLAEYDVSAEQADVDAGKLLETFERNGLLSKGAGDRS